MNTLYQLDLNLLIIYRHLLQDRSVAKVAKRMGVTSSAISKALARLREWFDDPLFLRGKNGMEPTILSLQIDAELQVWFDITNEITALKIDAIPNEGLFRLELESPFYTHFLNSLPTNIYKQYCNAHVTVLNWDHNSLSNIINGETDIGFCAREMHPRSIFKVEQLPYSINYEVLFKDRPVAFIRDDHPLHSKEWNLVNLISYSQVNVVWEGSRDWALDYLLTDIGLSRNIPIYVSSFEQALHIASQDCHELIAVVPSYCTEHAKKHYPNLISKPLPLTDEQYQQLHIYFILLWHKRNNNNTKIIWLRNEIERLSHIKTGCT
ncbi:HTH-type transcriptional regulator YidZ [Aeromonas veronii]|uniref:HTH-type transcriptional regulator YidZ n=1 Tax=Aeromonas veronii TaxID=654 RepID=UPI0011169747|nr:HTH-type transcriptional regulator YidZ [Aeromonas veronii]TNI01466.1 DNA-binding transcriptional regulator [Aeromonas veronii]HDO1310165.1 HTH-type transcriptional regulator YidZ [Aeromonas veronii]HDO1317761.1 HTH-type transcriptional regulator YidZ [Aeromonas veronii]HDO1331852.1 HTH-type transcriptional regulator YidZ [Aeromonas veronii]HDO1336374.1 HTH-type transcriptional regulator YidZ [Aeromonas veronii]